MDGNFAGTLRFAINNSAPGDTVLVPDNLGVYNLTLGALNITHSLTVQNGGPGAANPIIDGQANDRVFIITGSSNNTVNFNGLTIRNGLAHDADGGGGVEYAVAVGTGTGSLNFTNSLVTGNKTGATALKDGGGILTFGEPVSLNNTTVSFNNATGTGSTTMVEAEDDTPPNPTDVGERDEGNNSETESTETLVVSSEGGGGINTEGGSVTLTNNSHVDHNTTAGFLNGGGILTAVQNGFDVENGGDLNDTGNVSVTDSTVSFNTASSAGSELNSGHPDLTGGGGGIHCGAGSVTLLRSHVDSNTAAGVDGGGGILDEGQSSSTSNSGGVTLTDSTVNNNTVSNASAPGGGIECQIGTQLNDRTTIPVAVVLNNSSVNFNTAMGVASVGGGIDTQGGTVQLTNNSHVDHNTCAGFQNGGGIDSQGGRVQLTDSTVDCNVATGSGVVTDPEDGAPEVSEGGGGINSEGGTVTLLRSHVDGNKAAGNDNGGGIFTDGSTVVPDRRGGTPEDIIIIDSTVDWNVATGSGVVQNTENNGTPNFDPSGGGGGINTGGANLVVTRSHIDHNSAAGLEEGGAVFTDGGTVTMTDSTMDENASTGAGAAVIPNPRDKNFPAEPTQGGGAIDSGGAAVILMGTTGSHVDFNTSAGLGGGGGIDSQGGDVTLTNSTVIGNKATASGSVTVTVNNTQKVFNSEGGGGINTEGGNVTMTSSTVSCNSAAGLLGGGGILAVGPSDANGGGTGNVTATAGNNEVNRNTATTDGGGISAITVTLTGATVTRNSAADCGGLDLTGAGSTINASVVAGNSGTPHPNICGTFTGTGNTIGSTPPVEPPACPTPPVIPNPCNTQVNVTGQVRIYYGDQRYFLGNGLYGQLITIINNSNMDIVGPVTIVFPTLPPTVPIVRAQAGNGPATFTPNSVTLANGIPAHSSVTIFVVFFNPGRFFIGHAWLGIPTQVFAAGFG